MHNAVNTLVEHNHFAKVRPLVGPISIRRLANQASLAGPAGGIRLSELNDTSFNGDSPRRKRRCHSLSVLCASIIAVLTLQIVSASNAFAQGFTVVQTCGTPAQTLRLGEITTGFQDTTGTLCTESGGGGGGAVTTSPASRTIVALDIATVTTGGTAVAALSAGHRTAGGWIQNPPSATVNLCINEQGTASGTTSAGATTCIQPGQIYQLVPTTTAVSVISSDSAHPFSGLGLN